MTTNTTKPSITELSLIETSIAIGSVAESNATFTKGFAEYLDTFDKPLSELTVFQLLDALNKYRDRFNRPVKSKKPVRKTSRFNILDKSKRVVAESVTFNQAIGYRDCIIKFAGMCEVAA